MASTQSGWLRGVGVTWADVEPNPGDRRWSAMAQVERQWLNGIEQDLTLIALVGQSPAWARQYQGISCGPINPDHLNAFGAFMYDLVSRYSQEPFNIKYWELWNEPDIDWRQIPGNSPFGCWGERDDPFFGGGAYAAMLKVAYPQIKAADPEAQVLVGGLLLDCDPRNPPELPPGSGQFKDCAPARFFQGVLENGGGAFFDGISFHAYDYYLGAAGQYGNPNWHAFWDSSGPVLFPKLRFLQELLAEYGHQDKILLNTEAALLCGATGKEAVCQTAAFAETKASYLILTYAAARAEGLLANIWYNLKGWRASGLATGYLQPLPAFHAYQFGASQLGRAAFDGEITDIPGVRGYRFRREAERVWFLWSQDGGNYIFELPSIPDAMYDIYGSPLPAGQTVEITLAPVYVVWNLEQP